jgi:orotate phosphoribosyltransferase
MGQRVEGGLPAGARCLVVEDSMTTGGSALQAIEALREVGATVAAALVVVDREEGAREALDAQGIPLLALFTGRELLDAAHAHAPPPVPPPA